MSEVNAQDVLNQALHIAVSNADIEMAERLMQRGADANTPIEGSQSSFGLAVNLMMFDLADRMIAMGADVNHQKQAGESVPQWVACILRDAFKGGTARTQYFLRHGADFSLTFTYGTRTRATLADVLGDVRAIMTTPERAQLAAIEEAIWQHKHGGTMRNRQSQLAQRRAGSGRRYKL